MGHCRNHQDRKTSKISLGWRVGILVVSCLLLTEGLHVEAKGGRGKGRGSKTRTFYSGGGGGGGGASLETWVIVLIVVAVIIVIVCICVCIYHDDDATGVKPIEEEDERYIPPDI